jgi:hypothetical protein
VKRSLVLGFAIVLLTSPEWAARKTSCADRSRESRTAHAMSTVLDVRDLTIRIIPAATAKYVTLHADRRGLGRRASTVVGTSHPLA